MGAAAVRLAGAAALVVGLEAAGWANEIGERRENQQDRIAQGVKSGQLTAGETARLEHREARLNREIRTDRQANGGRLTRQERRQVNRQQNRLSRQIYRDKHDQRRQPR